MKTILEIGNCDADHSRMKEVVEANLDAKIVRAHRLDDAMEAMQENDIDLVLINRLLDVDGSEGMDVFRSIKSNSEFAGTPVMLITNFDEHQDKAVAEGTIRGFGKAALASRETIETLKSALQLS